MEQPPRPRCDGCGLNLEPLEEGPVVYDCFHALHAACAYGSAACPRCGAPSGGSPAAGGTWGNDDDDPFAAVEEERPARCDGCGGDFKREESIFWSECNHALHHVCAHTWRDMCPYCHMEWSSPVTVGVGAGPSDGSPPEPDSPLYYFSSPEPSPPPSHADQFGQQAPPATARPSAPPLPSHVGPFGQPPPTPANPLQPPAQFGPPPYFQPYPHADQFGQTPPAAAHAFALPQPPPTGQFAPPPYHPFSLRQPSSSSSYRPLQPLPPPAPQHPFHHHHQQQQQPAPAWFCCGVCGGAVGRGQTTVTSQCDHTFHFRCFAGSVCPVCGARWCDAGPVIPPPPFHPFQ